MTYQEMLVELKRQLTTGEATREQYRAAVDYCELQMAEMHAAACYDVRGYSSLEQSANCYREALSLEPSTVSARARVPASLSDAEYKPAISAQLPELSNPSQWRGFSGELWQECEHRGCHTEPVCVNCFRCRKHCGC